MATVNDVESVRIPAPHSGHWCWVVLTAAFVCGAFTAGYAKSIGILMVEWQLEYDVDAKDVSWIGISMTFVMTSGALVSSTVSKLCGTRITVVSGGVMIMISLLVASISTNLWHLYASCFLTGLGVTLGWIPFLCSLSYFFDSLLGVANGLGFAGAGAGLIIVPPVLQFLVDSYGWRVTLRLFSGCAIIVPLCGLTIKLTERERFMMREKSKDKRGCGEYEENQTGTKHGTKRKMKSLKLFLKSSYQKSGINLMFENWGFVYVNVAFFVANIGTLAAILNFNAKAVFDVGLSQLSASYVVSAIGLGNLIGRAVHGVFLDLKCMSPFSMFAFTSFVSAVDICCYPLLYSFWPIMGCAFIFGLFNGPQLSVVMMMLREVTPSGDIAKAFSVSVFCSGFAVTGGIFLMGYLFDVTGNYDLSFYVAGFSLFTSAIVITFQETYNRCHGHVNNSMVTEEECSSSKYEKTATRDENKVITNTESNTNIIVESHI